jgi:hypothetical protein
MVGPAAAAALAFASAARLDAYLFFTRATFEERLDALVSAGKRKSDGLDAESSVPQVITNMLEATRELLSRPMPLADRTTRDRTATLRLLVELKSAKDDGRFLVSRGSHDIYCEFRHKVQD